MYTASNICQSLGRGINMGNALDAPKEGEWGVMLQPEFFGIIARAGFDSVRIPVRWSAHAMEEAPYTIDPEFMARVDWAVDEAMKNGLAVVVDIHHYNELFDDPAGHKERFLSITKQIARHFKDRPPTLVHEILNEPHGRLTAEMWNEYLAEAVAIARRESPKRTLMVGTAEWGGVGGLKKLQLPEGEHNIIVTYHYYEPFHFTHQGAEWAEGSNEWLGLTWTGTQAEKQAVTNQFNSVAIWAHQQGVPIYMGEFGAYSKADEASRNTWTNFVAREAEQRGFSWAYWEFCSGFGAYDSVLGKWNEPIRLALIPRWTEFPRFPMSCLGFKMPQYPDHWWLPVPEEGAPSWEILPQAASPFEVILSKRHELGLLSNFAPTPFVYRGKQYASLEGFWQMMLYPEGPDDPRATHPGLEWKYTRDQVAAMSAFEAKDAGFLAYKNMEKMGITWVSFEGQRFEYRQAEPGEHYRLIVEAMREKLNQNPDVRAVLLSTGDLKLRPDHHQEPDSPPEWRYFEVWEQLRGELLKDEGKRMKAEG